MNFSLQPGHVYVVYAYSGELGYCHHVVSMGVEFVSGGVEASKGGGETVEARVQPAARRREARKKLFHRQASIVP